MTTRLSQIIFYIGFGYLILALLLVIAHDFLELFNISPNVVFIYHLYRQGSPTEWLQWFSLSGCVIAAGFLWGKLSERQHAATAAFAFWSFGLALMVLEDAGNLRHTTTAVLTSILHSDVANPRDMMDVRGRQELVIYALLGFLLIWPLLRYGRKIPFCSKSKKFFTIGYIAYAVAALASASRHQGNWYVHVGGAIRRLTGKDDSALWLGFEANNLANAPRLYHQTLDFYIMDYMLEETLELTGALCLLIGFLTIISRVRTNAP